MCFYFLHLTTSLSRRFLRRSSRYSILLKSYSVGLFGFAGGPPALLPRRGELLPAAVTRYTLPVSPIFEAPGGATTAFHASCVFLAALDATYDSGIPLFLLARSTRSLASLMTGGISSDAESAFTLYEHHITVSQRTTSSST